MIILSETVTSSSKVLVIFPLFGVGVFVRSLRTVVSSVGETQRISKPQ
jgi:hypothetical protein